MNALIILGIFLAIIFGLIMGAIGVAMIFAGFEICKIWLKDLCQGCKERRRLEEWNC